MFVGRRRVYGADMGQDKDSALVYRRDSLILSQTRLERLIG